MKLKDVSVTIQELLNDLYLSVFNDKSDVDDLMKYVSKGLEFFCVCSSIELPSDIKGGKSSPRQMNVVFTDNNPISISDLSKTSVINSMVQVISNSVSKFLKKVSAKTLYLNCYDFYKSIKKHNTSIPYNLIKLEKILCIMSELISYNISITNAFTWAATSFIFHIIYVNITSSLTLHHQFLMSTKVSPQTDAVTSLSHIFESKRKMIDQVLVEILPKIISFFIDVSNDQISFYRRPVSAAEANPIIKLISQYRNDTLTPKEAKEFMISHGHNIIQLLNNPVIGGAPSISSSDKAQLNNLMAESASLLNNDSGDAESSSLKRTDQVPIPDSQTILRALGSNTHTPPITLPASANLSKLAANLPALMNQKTTPPQKRAIDPNMKMPDDKDYKKIILMKFIALLEKCVAAQKDQKSPQSISYVSVFDRVKTITMKDGVITVHQVAQ